MPEVGRTTHNHVEWKLTFNGIITGCTMTLFRLFCSTGFLPVCCRWLGDPQARAGVPTVHHPTGCLGSLWLLEGEDKPPTGQLNPVSVASKDCQQELGERDSPLPMKSPVKGRCCITPGFRGRTCPSLPSVEGNWIPRHPVIPGCRYRNPPGMTVQALWFWATL